MAAHSKRESEILKIFRENHVIEKERLGVHSFLAASELRCLRGRGPLEEPRKHFCKRGKMKELEFVLEWQRPLQELRVLLVISRENQAFESSTQGTEGHGDDRLAGTQGTIDPKLCGKEPFMRFLYRFFVAMQRGQGNSNR
jgi:hypothetical protein